MAHDVFISHATENGVIALAAVAKLEAAGVRCWIAPRDIQPGQSWPTAITSAIRGSAVFVLIFSGESNDSEHVGREVNLALDAGCAIVPVRIADVPAGGALSYALAGVHWLDALTEPMDDHLAIMTRNVQLLVQQRTPAPGAPAAPPLSEAAPNQVAPVPPMPTSSPSQGQPFAAHPHAALSYSGSAAFSHEGLAAAGYTGQATPASPAVAAQAYYGHSAPMAGTVNPAGTHPLHPTGFAPPTGMQPPRPAAPQAPRQKSAAVALILATTLGWLGAHRFYLGKPGTAVAQALTFGGLLAWVFADIGLILAGKMTDGQGRPLERTGGLFAVVSSISAVISGILTVFFGLPGIAYLLGIMGTQMDLGVGIPAVIMAVICALPLVGLAHHARSRAGDRRSTETGAGGAAWETVEPGVHRVPNSQNS